MDDFSSLFGAAASAAGSNSGDGIATLSRGVRIINEQDIRDQVADEVMQHAGGSEQKKAQTAVAEASKKRAAAEEELRRFYRASMGSSIGAVSKEQKDQQAQQLQALRAAVANAAREQRDGQQLLDNMIKERRLKDKAERDAARAVAATPQQLQELHQRATGNTLLLLPGRNQQQQPQRQRTQQSQMFQTPAPRRSHVIVPGAGSLPSEHEALAAEYSGGALVTPSTRVVVGARGSQQRLSPEKSNKKKASPKQSGRKVKKEQASDRSSSSSDSSSSSSSSGGGGGGGSDDDEDEPFVNRLQRGGAGAVRRTRKNESSSSSPDKKKQRKSKKKKKDHQQQHTAIDRFTVSDNDEDYSSTSASSSSSSSDDAGDDDSEDSDYEASFSDTSSSSSSSSGESDDDAAKNRNKKHHHHHKIKEEAEIQPTAEDLRPVQIDPASPGYVIPTYVWKALLPYQQDALRWFSGLHRKRVGGILGDDLGLGKTVQAGAFIHALHFSNQLRGPVLILAPLTVLAQWRREMRKWCAPLPVVILHSMELAGANMKTTINNKVKDKPVVALSTYASFQRSAEAFARANFDYIVLDEGHKISNPETQISIAVKTLPSSNRIILSGSPIQNGLLEIWSLFDFCCPGLLGGATSFVTAFDDPIKASRNPHATPMQLATAVECAKALRMQISPFLLRRLKKDVNRMLPPKLEKAVMCPLTDKQLQAYVDVLSSTEVRQIERRYTSVRDELRTLDKHGRELGGGGLNNLGVNRMQNVKGVVSKLWAIMADLRSICDHVDIFTVRNAHREEKAAAAVKGGLVSLAGSKAVPQSKQQQDNAKKDQKKKKKRRPVDDDDGDDDPFAMDVNDDHDEADVDGEDDDGGSSGKKKKKHGGGAGGSSATAKSGKSNSNKSISFRSNKPVDLEGSSKMIALSELLKDWHPNGHKALIFSQTRMMLDVVENLVSQRGYTYIRLDGTTPGQQRHELVHRFNHDPSIFCALLTTRVGGLGLNLTGADRVVLMSCDYNPCTDEQAKERAWRIGQTREVHVLRLISSGTIEEHILHRQMAKMFVTEKVLSDPTLQRFFSIHNLTDAFRLGGEYTERVAECCHGTVVSHSVSLRAPIKNELREGNLGFIDAEDVAEFGNGGSVSHRGKSKSVKKEVKEEFIDHNDDDDDDDDDPFAMHKPKKKRLINNNASTLASQISSASAARADSQSQSQQQQQLQRQRSQSQIQQQQQQSSSSLTFRVLDDSDVVNAPPKKACGNQFGAGDGDDADDVDDTGTGLLGALVDGRTDTKTMRRAASGTSLQAQQLATLSALGRLKSVLTAHQQQQQQQDQQQQQQRTTSSQQPKRSNTHQKQ